MQTTEAQSYFAMCWAEIGDLTARTLCTSAGRRLWRVVKRHSWENSRGAYGCTLSARPAGFTVKRLSAELPGTRLG